MAIEFFKHKELRGEELIKKAKELDVSLYDEGEEPDKELALQRRVRKQEHERWDRNCLIAILIFSAISSFPALLIIFQIVLTVLKK